MVSGQGNAQSFIYKKHTGKSGANWFIPINSEEPAAHVQVHYPSSKYSDGYGGAALLFQLDDGTTYRAQGPWHSNSDSLFRDTGIDIRDKHLTFVVLSKASKGYPTELIDVVYQDPQPLLGKFDRYKDLIKQFPEARYYYSESSGGSFSGPCNT